MVGLHIALPFHRLTFCSVRRQATDFHSSAPPPTLETAIEVIEGQRPAVQVDTEVGDVRPADQRDMSPRGSARSTRRPRERMLFTQTRCASPEARFVCNGWCNYNEEQHPNVVSIWHLYCGTVGLMFVGSFPFLLVQTCNGHGRDRMVRLPQCCATTLVSVHCAVPPYQNLTRPPSERESKPSYGALMAHIK